MDARKLRKIDASDFMGKLENAQDLTAALDDGFVLTDRQDLIRPEGQTPIPLYLVGWETSNGIGGDYVEVWALAMFGDGDVRKVKFRDGGRSFDGIPATLRKLTQNGVYGNVRLVMMGEEYSFFDKETGEPMTACRYTLHDPEMMPAEKVTKTARKNVVKDENEPPF